MARVIRTKECVNARLLKQYGSWVYCDVCQKTVAYLCYSGYHAFKLDFKCLCGSEGNVFIALDEASVVSESLEPLMMVDNRLACPHDKSKLFSTVDKNLVSYRYEVSCQLCKSQFVGDVKRADD